MNSLPSCAGHTSILLMSGGLDSSANLALALEQGERPYLLNIQYGQRAAAREWEATQAFATFYRLGAGTLHLPWVGALGGSALTEFSQAMPKFEVSELDEEAKTQESSRAVWVPNRNGLFLSVAASVAEANDINQVLVGFNREEAATFADNTAEFMDAANLALSYSTRNSVRVRSYTVDWNKSEIVQALRSLKLKKFPFDLLWSCYQNGTKPCLQCESCQRLRRALEASQEFPDEVLRELSQVVQGQICT